MWCHHGGCSFYLILLEMQLKHKLLQPFFRFVEQTIQRITVGAEAVTPQNINNRFESRRDEMTTILDLFSTVKNMFLLLNRY